MTLGGRICALRTARGLSQSDLAEHLEVSRQSVSKWETDASVPDLERLVKMSELFGVSLDQLVRGEESAGGENSQPDLPQAPTVSQAAPAPGGLTVRVAVGLLLLFLGGVVFLLCTLSWGAAIQGVILAAPFLLCGAICLAVRRHPALICGWVLWVLGYAYFRYGTGIRVWWIVLLGIYRQEMWIHAMIAWGEALTLAALIFATVRLVGRRAR